MATKELCDEYLLSVDKVNKPTKLDDEARIYTLLYRLILLEPGTYQSNPDMGVGIVSKYRYGNETDIEDLKADITEQIQTYLPGFELAGVEVDSSDLAKKILNIKITLNDIVYSLDVSTELESMTSLL